MGGCSVYFRHQFARAAIFADSAACITDGWKCCWIVYRGIAGPIDALARLSRDSSANKSGRRVLFPIRLNFILAVPASQNSQRRLYL